MGLSFEWDPRKAAANEKKHGVVFKEASTVFADPLAWLQPDAAHSLGEDRLLLLGRSSENRLLAVLFTVRGDALVRISAPAAPPCASDGNMKKTSAKPPRRRAPSAADLEPEYEWSMAVRNPYAARYAAGSNIVVLEPDVAAVFPNAASVNEALRSLASVMAGRTPKPPTRRRSA